MKRVIAVLSMSVVSLFAGVASAQAPAQTPAPVAGMQPLGITVTQMEAVVVGWSVKKQLLGKAVLNDKNEKIGKIEDLILAPSADGKGPQASFAIIGTGGFLGMGKHDVAIPVEQFKMQGTNLMLPGASKDALKALPPFEYKK
jgi:sporulation protein YlmC with PRC-barrel domain